GGELAAAGADLDDAVGFGLGKSTQGAIERGQRGDVDGRIRIVTLLGGIEHGAVLGGGGNGHGFFLAGNEPGATVRECVTRKAGRCRAPGFRGASITASAATISGARFYIGWSIRCP